MTDYNRDLALWSKEQADALRARGGGNALDYANLAEEIESLGRSDRREIESRLEVLLAHLLKLAYQPAQASPSWRASVREARNRIADLIVESPSLGSYPEERLARAYARARVDAADETGIGTLPEVCPWPADEVLSDWLPSTPAPGGD